MRCIQTQQEIHPWNRMLRDNKSNSIQFQSSFRIPSSFRSRGKTTLPTRSFPWEPKTLSLRGKSRWRCYIKLQVTCSFHDFVKKNVLQQPCTCSVSKIWRMKLHVVAINTLDIVYYLLLMFQKFTQQTKHSGTERYEHFSLVPRYNGPNHHTGCKNGTDEGIRYQNWF
jgi:hypothetical protein